MAERTDRRELPPTAGLPLLRGDLAGHWNRSLAQALAPHLGTDQALLTCSGTAALIVALRTLMRDSRRREVVVPAYTCPLVALAVAHCGLTLRLCDARPDHFEMDPDALRAACGDDTLAVVPAHLGGRLADMATVGEIAHATGAVVIEDAAQALGARHAGGTPAGLAGDIGFVSLAAGKGLSIFEGGLLFSRSPARLAALRDTAASVLPRRPGWELRRSMELLGYAALYNPRGLRPVYGRPLRRALRRGDPVTAVGDRFASDIPLHRVGRWREAVGARAAQRLPAFMSSLRNQAQVRVPLLRAIPGVKVMEDTGGARGTWPQLMLLMPEPARRDAALDQLWQRGMGVSRLFIHALPDYGYLRGTVPPADVPHARDFAGRSLTISNSPWLDTATFRDIVRILEAAAGT